MFHLKLDKSIVKWKLAESIIIVHEIGQNLRVSCDEYSSKLLSCTHLQTSLKFAQSQNKIIIIALSFPTHASGWLIGIFSWLDIDLNFIIAMNRPASENTIHIEKEGFGYFLIKNEKYKLVFGFNYQI